jgi:hypothetical protein
MTTVKTVARIGALRKYIALLQLEQQHLKRMKSSPHSTEHERLDAARTLQNTHQKLAAAEKELTRLEPRWHPFNSVPTSDFRK